MSRYNPRTGTCYPNPTDLGVTQDLLWFKLVEFGLARIQHQVLLRYVVLHALGSSCLAKRLRAMQCRGVGTLPVLQPSLVAQGRCDDSKHEMAMSPSSASPKCRNCRDTTWMSLARPFMQTSSQIAFERHSPYFSLLHSLLTLKPIDSLPYIYCAPSSYPT